MKWKKPTAGGRGWDGVGVDQRSHDSDCRGVPVSAVTCAGAGTCTNVTYPDGANMWFLGSTMTLGGSSAPPGWVTSNTSIPAPTPFPSATGCSTWEAIDVQVQFYAEASPARIDEMVSYS
jgi:hypothetical protein